MIEKSVEGQDFVWRSYASATEGNFQNYDVFLFKIRYISIWGGGGVKKGQKRSDVFYGRPPIPSVRQHVFFSFSLILIPTNFNPLLLCFKLPALSILVNPVQTQLLPMVFCYHNCSNVLWEKIVLVWGKKLRKKFANSRP